MLSLGLENFVLVDVAVLLALVLVFSLRGQSVSQSSSAMGRQRQEGGRTFCLAIS